MRDEEQGRISMKLYHYVWGNNPMRKKYQNRRCKVLARGKMNSVQIEFEDGHQMITSRNAIKLAAGRAEE